MRNLLISIIILLLASSSGSVCKTDSPMESGLPKIDASGMVYNVVDGETFNVTDFGRVRLADVDSPEIETPEGEAAKLYTQLHLQGKMRIFNRGEESVDVGGWTLSTTSGDCVTLTIPEGTSIEPGESHLVARGCRWLDNSDESIVLKTNSNLEVDRTLPLSDDDNDGQVWFRSEDGSKWRYGWP